MELQVYLIIVTVFFVSLGSLLFINRHFCGSKTFEQALAEKRQLTEKLYGNKKKNVSKKSNPNKKVTYSSFLNWYFSIAELSIKIITPKNHISFEILESQKCATATTKAFSCWKRHQIGEWLRDWWKCLKCINCFQWERTKNACWIHWSRNQCTGIQHSFQSK